MIYDDIEDISEFICMISMTDIITSTCPVTDASQFIIHANIPTTKIVPSSTRPKTSSLLQNQFLSFFITTFHTVDIVQSVSSTLISFLATANTYFDTEKSVLIDLIMKFFYFERPATWRMSSINMAVKGRVSMHQHALVRLC
jgi:hypothetical protein